MPYEIFGIPALLCFILGFMNGLKAMKKSDETRIN